MAITIINQPIPFTGAIGDDFGLHVDAEGEAQISYRWQFSTNGSSWSNSTIDGRYTPYLHGGLTEARLAYYFRCRMNEAGSSDYVYTEPVKLSVGTTPRSLALLKQLWDAKYDIRAAIVDKGVSAPADAKFGDMAGYIAQIVVPT